MTDDAVKKEESEELNPKKRGLGRGLDALFGDEEGRDEETDVSRETSVAKPASGALKVNVAEIRPSQFQPRRSFDPETIDELAQSIDRHGIIQPLVVRLDPEGGATYELIAGERRWRAAQKIQLHEVPVVIQEMSDTEVLEVALIENLQREDLNAIEEAQGYQRLTEDFGYSQSELAEHLSKSRPYIVNTMRLLKLPGSVQEMVVLGALTAGHARTLVGHDDAEALAQEIIDRRLSVREAEELTRQGPKKPHQKPQKDSKSEKGADTIALENEMTDRLGMKLEINGKGHAGKVIIHYKDFDQLDDLIHRLSHNPGKQ